MEALAAARQLLSSMFCSYGVKSARCKAREALFCRSSGRASSVVAHVRGEDGGSSAALLDVTQDGSRRPRPVITEGKTEVLKGTRPGLPRRWKLLALMEDTCSSTKHVGEGAGDT